MKYIVTKIQSINTRGIEREFTHGSTEVYPNLDSLKEAAQKLFLNQRIITSMDAQNAFREHGYTIFGEYCVHQANAALRNEV